MSFVDEVVGVSRITLAKESNNKPKVSKTADNQKTTVTRVDKKKIREVCMQDAISFNMLNLYTNIIMKAGYKFTGTCDKYEELFVNMMKHGDRSSIRRLFKEIQRDRAEYGAAFVEIIPYEDQPESVADLRRINASRIDYARDKLKNIILDSEKIPYGFVMNFGSGAKGIPDGDLVPVELQRLGFSLKKGEIYLKNERIAVFPLNRLDNNYDYLGLIEPAYQDIVDRLETMKIQVDAIKVKATSLPVIYVGDSTHEATPQAMDDADYILENLKEATGISMPQNMKMETIEYKTLDTIDKTIRMLLSSSATASGSPLALISGDGEACYSEDTLTLTNNGWKYFWEVKDEDKIATVNPETFEIEYHKPTDKRVYDFNGKMHHYNSTNVDILVTPQHKMFYKGINSSEWKKEPSKDIKINNFKFKCNVEFEGKEVEKIIIPEIEYDQQSRIINKGDLVFNADDWFEFIGYYVSEGWCGVNKNKYPIELSNIDDKILKKMSSCLDRMDIKWNYKKGDGRIEGVRFNNKSLAIYLHNNFGKISQEKRLLDEYKDISKRQMNILVDALLDGDESRFDKTGICYYTSSKKLMNQVCDIFLKLGYAVSYNDYTKKTSILSYYRISGNKTRLETNIRRSKNFKEIDYNGKVYCYEVPNHLFITSRNGKIAIQGNTNKSTLTQQIEMMIIMFQSQIEDFVEDWNVQIMSRIREGNNFKEDCVLLWNGIRYQDKEEEKNLIIDSFKIGGISSSEYRLWLKENISVKLDNKFEEKFGTFINYPNKFHSIYKKNKSVDTSIEKSKPQPKTKESIVEVIEKPIKKDNKNSKKK